MASIVNKFNAVSSKAVLARNTRKIEELVESKPYIIQQVRVVNTPYGKSAVAMVLGEEDKEFDLFLPKRFTSVFESEEIEPNTIQLIREKPLGPTYDIKLERKSDIEIFFVFTT